MSLYVPMNTAFLEKNTDWVFAHLDSMTYEMIARRGVVLWCEDNLEGRWTMLGGNKFAFEDGTDALAFKLQCGL